MFDHLETAIDSAVNSGAKYSDARILISKSRNIAAKNGEVENYNESEKIGIGIRAASKIPLTNMRNHSKRF